MPTPNIYAASTENPFADVPAPLQSTHVDVLYYTDRQLDNNDPAHPIYGYQRSRSSAFGLAQVDIGKNLSWDQLVHESRTQHRNENLQLSVSNTHELGRLLPTPRVLVLPSETPSTQPDQPDPAEDAFRQLLAQRLALSPVKDVYIFVHGFSNKFDDSLYVIADLWHFLGRRGVPIAYSWPAGSKGAFAYFYDRESSEFTVFHLKQMLRLIASCPEVQNVHIIAHSRGTDVVVSAIRELFLEIRGTGKNTRDVLKLKTIILAAPDLDVDVIIQRLVTDRIGLAAGHNVVYICADDKALGLSNWLFGGMMRLGQLQSRIFSHQELDNLRQVKRNQIIEARVSDAGNFNHNYFYKNPAVSSDLILILRDNLPPGPPQRPLQIDNDGFWSIYDGYPTTQPANP
jgi:esterase/lipase superfamily enzyme